MIKRLKREGRYDVEKVEFSKKGGRIIYLILSVLYICCFALYTRIYDTGFVYILAPAALILLIFHLYVFFYISRRAFYIWNFGVFAQAKITKQRLQKYPPDNPLTEAIYKFYVEEVAYSGSGMVYQSDITMNEKDSYVGIHYIAENPKINAPLREDIKKVLQK